MATLIEEIQTRLMIEPRMEKVFREMDIVNENVVQEELSVEKLPVKLKEVCSAKNIKISTKTLVSDKYYQLEECIITLQSDEEIIDYIHIRTIYDSLNLMEGKLVGLEHILKVFYISSVGWKDGDKYFGELKFNILHNFGLNRIEK